MWDQAGPARRMRSAVIVLAGVLVAAGCSSGGNGAANGASSPPGSGRADGQPALVVGEDAAAPLAGPVGSWAGTVAGTSALAAVVSDGRQVKAYVCDSNEGCSEAFPIDVAVAATAAPTTTTTRPPKFVTTSTLAS